MAAFEVIQERIAEGWTYQVNLTARLGSEPAGSHVRVWLNEKATHVQASERPGRGTPVPTTRLIDWIGTVEQAVLDLVAGKKGPKMTPVESAGLGIGLGKTQLNGRGANMAGLASVLSSRVAHQVIDKTGLTGFYNFTLTWTPDDANGAENGPSLFAALEEQLGLRLEPGKALVETLIIEGVERPAGN